jgi:hypothetical protein
MAYYIAELDEAQQIAAVWIKESMARGPRVFDPAKHFFDADTASGFIGATKEEIASWIDRAGLSAQHTSYS